MSFSFSSSKHEKDLTNMPQESVIEGKEERLAMICALDFAAVHKISFDKKGVCAKI